MTHVSGPTEVPPSEPLGQQGELYWLLVPREPQPNTDIPNRPFLARFASVENSQRDPYEMRRYEASGKGESFPGSELVTGNDEVWLAEKYPAYEPNKPSLLPGHFHPRIWRNGWAVTQRARMQAQPPRDFAVTRRATAVSTHRLLEQMSLIFENVQPTQTNAESFGAAMRHLLILACTEVEAAWRGILIANNYTGALQSPARLTTRDYVKLCSPMRLHQYKARLALYQDEWKNDFQPFATWREENPSESLPWYSAYNAAKHDREGSSSRANLRSVIDAVAAASILLVAQFGKHAPEVKHTINHISGFEFTKEPEWAPNELYFPADECGFQSVPLW